MAKVTKTTIETVESDDSATSGSDITVLNRTTISPTALSAGDKFSQEIIPGTVLQEVLLTAAQAMTANEAVLFETVFEGRPAIGGFVLAKP